MIKRKKFNWYGRKQRFSIRKYHFGAASVLLGTVLMLGVHKPVAAQENILTHALQGAEKEGKIIEKREQVIDYIKQ